MADYLTKIHDNMAEFTQIKNIEQLKSLFSSSECNGCCGEFFIQLSLGRSWKTIYYDTETDIFYIANQVDESEQDLTTEELFDSSKTSIGEAINKGAFYFAWF